MRGSLSVSERVSPLRSACPIGADKPENLSLIDRQAYLVNVAEFSRERDCFYSSTVLRACQPCPTWVRIRPALELTVHRDQKFSDLSPSPPSPKVLPWSNRRQGCDASDHCFSAAFLLLRHFALLPHQIRMRGQGRLRSRTRGQSLFACRAHR
jgi:hypothetical protein